ncbi:MAG: beta-Ala-His dipeptidase, partial [Bacteroidales bacterium]
YLKNFAKQNNLAVKEDEVGNILISKPATLGKESAPMLTLQAHMDMVCEKNNGVIFNFDKDPIKTRIDDDWVRAEETTLGADNGIGIAAALAVLTDENIQHGPIEALFTVDEETGLTGAYALKDNFIKGKYLINLDSEEEGEIFVGCAGGIDTIATFPYHPMMTPPNYHYLKISVSGLRGGHSGSDINEGRGNSLKILTRFLCRCAQIHDIVLCSLEGGNLRNAIPREASAVIGIHTDNKEKVTVDLNIFNAAIAEELHCVDPGFKMEWESLEPQKLAIDRQASFGLLNSLNACPHGVISMSHNIKGLVETSTNLASVKKSGDSHIIVTTSQRSSVDSMKSGLACSIKSLFSLAGAKIAHSDGYPGWKPNVDSNLLKLAIEAYQELSGGKKPEIKA